MTFGIAQKNFDFLLLYTSWIRDTALALKIHQPMKILTIILFL